MIIRLVQHGETWIVTFPDGRDTKCATWDAVREAIVLYDGPHQAHSTAPSVDDVLDVVMQRAGQRVQEALGGVASMLGGVSFRHKGGA